MRQASAKTWVISTVFLSVLLLVAAWLLAVQPVMARAAEDTVQAQQSRDQNALLELEIAKLTEQQTHLPEYQAQLAALRLQIPSGTDPAGISRELPALAAAAGLTILAVQPSVPESFVPPAAPAVNTDSATAEPVEGTDDAAAAAASEVVPGFYQVPVTITSLGTYEASVAFLRGVQESASRLYLVSAINATTQDAEGASAGRPATAKGDIELAMTGYVFVLADSAADAARQAANAAETVPVPGAQANPFLPGR
jgi:Tfp pilus assembly protein PilO